MSVMVLLIVVVILAHYILDSVEQPHHKAAAAQLLAPEQQSQVIDRHNSLRSKQQAADMELMAWDDYLASMAQIWADRCKLEYRDGKDDIGNNVYAVSGDQFDPTAGVQSWYEERAHYNRSGKLKCAFGKTCRHYTQMIWADSRLVGCAYQRCRPLLEKGTTLYDNGTLFVCYYKPAGNARRPGRAGAWLDSAPFKKGPACSQCGSGAAWCKNGLCNSNCSADDDECTCKVLCYNCPKLFDAVSLCRCFCADGWFGVDCTLPCEDSHDYCNSTWSYPDWCQVDTVPEHCPVMCSRCIPHPNAQKCDAIHPDEILAHVSATSTRCQHVTVTAMTIYVSAVVSISNMHHFIPAHQHRH